MALSNWLCYGQTPQAGNESDDAVAPLFGVVQVRHGDLRFPSWPSAIAPTFWPMVILMAGTLLRFAVCEREASARVSMWIGAGAVWFNLVLNDISVVAEIATLVGQWHTLMDC